jgi:hypothetical protein
VAAAVTASLPSPSRPKAVLSPRRGGTHRLSPRT